MKAVITKFKKSVSLVLAVMMVLTAMPQASFTVYGAGQNISKNETLNVDTETTVEEIEVTDETEATDETVEVTEEEAESVSEEEAKSVSEEVAEEISSSDEEDALEETQSEVIEEDILEDDSLEVEEENLLIEDTSSGKFRFDANGGTMPIDDNAINISENVDGKCTWQEFEYSKENDSKNKYGVPVTNIDISPNKDGYRFNGWYYEDGSVLKLSDYFDNPNVDRTVYAKWIEQISSTPEIAPYYGNENGIKYIKKGNSLNVSLKVSRETFPLSELGEGESIVLYYWYGSDKTVYDGSDDTEDGYYHRWNGYPITVYNKDSDAEITFKLFDNVNFDTANVKIKLKYCIVTDGPYIHQDLTNVVDEGEECIIEDTYSDISKLNFVVDRTPSGYTGYYSGVKLYEKESDGCYRELHIESDDDDNPKYEFRNGKEIALYFNGFYGCKSDQEQRNSLQPTGVYCRRNNSKDDWTKFEKQAINVKNESSSPAEINLIENCYIIPANMTSSDLAIVIDTRFSNNVTKISFNNTEEAEYSVSYSNVPGEDDNYWTEVQNRCIDSPMTEGDIIYLRFKSNGVDKKIGKISSSAGKIYKTTINEIECYKLDLNNLNSNIEDLTVDFSFIEDTEGVGEVCYYDGDVDITVMDGDTPVEGFITERISGNYSRNLYKLTTGKNYKLTVKCKDGYYFNGEGVEFKGSHTNKNTAAPYIKKNFVAGNKVSTYTGECVHLIFNNANNTTYGGKGIAPSVKNYKPSDTAKTAKTITPNKTAKDGSCEYYLPVLDENSDCRYEVVVNPKDANGSPVSATLVGANPQVIKYGNNRCINLEVNSYISGKYEWNVECVSNKAIPNITYVENETSTITINPTTANGNIFYVPRNRQFVITEINKDGRKSKITACRAECDGNNISNKLTTHTGIGGDSEVIFYGLGSEYAGKTITVTMFTDISAVAGNTVTLKVAPAITKVTVNGVKSVGPKGGDQYSALTQEIGIVSGKVYAYTLAAAEKASFDELKAVVFADEEAANAEGVNYKTQGSSNDNISVEVVAGNKINIVTKNSAPKDKAGYVVIYNNDTNRKVGGFYVNTTTPSWAKSAPTASLVTASDVALNLKVTAPKGVNLNDNYYVAVKLAANKKTKIPEDKGLTINDTVKYYKVSGGKIPGISINAFKKDDEETSTLGAGCGTSMDANVYLVLTSDGTKPDESEEDNIVASTVAKKITVATKTPYYADKISLKKGATNLYAGQSGIKIADINFGTKTTYNTTDYWKVKSVVDAKGNDASSYFTFKTGTDAGKSATDTGIYAEIANNTPAGKYKVIVQTVIGGAPQAAEAAVEFTVIPTIANLTIYIDGQQLSISMYKRAGTALSKKITVSAYDQDGKVIKNPKVKYEVWKYVDGTREPASDSEISIKNNTINVAKNLDAGNLTKYRIIAHPGDVPDKQPSYIDLNIKNSTQNIGKLELYKKVGEGESAQYVPITSSDEISFSKRRYLYIKVFDKDGTCLFPNDNGNPEFHWSNSDDTIWIDDSKLNAVKAPGTVQLTACGLDGTKASASVNIAYDDSDGFNKLLVRYTTGPSILMTDEENKKSIDISDKPASEILYLSLCNGSGTKTYSEGYGEYQYLIEGTMKTEGLKVLEKSSNSQYMKVQLTKPTATVKFTDKDKVEHVWTIKNSALSQVVAPKVASIVVNGAKGTGKVYANYVYKADDKLVLTLKNPITDSSGKVLGKDKFDVVLQSASANIFGESGPAPEYYVSDNLGTEKKPKYIATITIPIDGKINGKTTLELAYKDKETKNYLTKSNTVATVSPVAFKKSFAVNSTQTMSLKDGYAINIATKSVGVSEVEYTGLLNYNKGGKYNNFTDLYKIDDNNRLTIKDAAAKTALFAASNVDKKGYPLPMDGYVKCKVTYESGEVAYFTSKITVKWGSAQVGKYTIERYDVPVSIYDNYYVVNLWDASKNEVSYKEIKLANLKKDSPVITGVFEYGMGNLCVSVAGNTKPGTYKSTALMVLEDSGCPHSGSQITDDEWAKYGVQVPITIKVVP